MLRLRAPMFALCLAFSAPLVGCATTGSGNPRVEGAITPVAVSEADFAASVHKVLRDGKPSPERLGLLVGVVRRQMAHAAMRYAAGHDARATDSVTGALYLVRAGEGRGEMIDAEGSRALAGAMDRLAPRGDEGRTLALGKMRQPTLAPGSRDRVLLDEHLAALDVWSKEVRNGGPLTKLGEEQRAAVGRSLLEPSDQALDAAARALDAWMEGANRVYSEVEQSGRNPDPSEWLEVKRAAKWGGLALAAIFVRHGDAKGALEHVERSIMGKEDVALNALLRAAAKHDGANEWLALGDAFLPRREDVDKKIIAMDSDLAYAAYWGAAVEAYRRDPKSLDTAVRLGRLLVEYGIPEAVPPVLADAIAAHSSAESRSLSMEFLLASLSDANEIEGPEAARRVFAAAPRLLAEADKGKADPSSARARLMMATIEVRAGNLAGAAPLLREANKAEPTTSGFTTLALVDRQSGNVKEAIEAIGLALRAPDARQSVLDVAEANLVGFELYRETGAQPEAKRALDAALAAVLVGRQQRGDAASRARAERLLGRILEGYGETKGAARAFERALAAAAADKPSFGAAMLDAIGRALLRRDLVAARASLKKGLEADVSEDDLVYGALWVQLLEKELKAPPDGTVERALHTGTHTQWTAKLTAWASGKISDNDLTTAAQNTSQKVEAAFYTAMASRVAGDPNAAQRLRAVAMSPAIDLLEVQIAREMVSTPLRPALPGGVQLP